MTQHVYHGMVISAHRQESESSRLTRLTKLSSAIVAAYYILKTEPYPTILHDHKGVLFVGWPEKPPEVNLHVVESLWYNLFCEHIVKHKNIGPAMPENLCWMDNVSFREVG